MSYGIAAAGTGGHVFPGLAVAEALAARGVERERVVFFGGSRMEAEAVPRAGFGFVPLRIRGLSRSLSPANLALPAVVWKAAGAVRREIEERGMRAVLGMGGYVTVPAALGARRAGTPLFLHEQNRRAGLANRMCRRGAERCFGSFPETDGLPGAVPAGYPLRPLFDGYQEERWRAAAAEHYRLDPGLPTMGAFGGSQGSAAINRAVGELAAGWEGPPLQVVHLTGGAHLERTAAEGDAASVTRRTVGFERRMELFYAVCDLVVGRAGAGLFEIASTGTPAVLAPGPFAGRHQLENASAMAETGAAVMLAEENLHRLPETVAGLLADEERRRAMGAAARAAARPGAARAIAAAMLEAGDAPGG